MRINQISRKYAIDNKDILEYLESIGVENKSHSSSLDEGTLDLLLQHFGKIEPKKTDTAVKVSNRFAKIRRPKNWKPGDAPEADTIESPRVSMESRSADATVYAERPAARDAVQEPLDHENTIREAPSQEASDKEIHPEALPLEASAPAATESSAHRDEKADHMSPIVVEPEIHPSPDQVQRQDSAETVSKHTPAAAERAPLIPERGSKTDRFQPRPGAQQQQAKRHKPKPSKPERRDDRAAGQPVIIIEAPQIKPEEIDAKTAAKQKTPLIEKEDKQRDQDEAIRREIQKLKLKQKRGPGVKEEEKSPTTGRTGGRRPVGQPRSKGKAVWKKTKRERRVMQIAAEEQRMERERTILKVHDATTVADIANGLGINPNELIAKLIGLGVMATINQRLDMDTIQIIAEEYNFHVERVDLYGDDVFNKLLEEDTDPSRAIMRPPVVTVMGHVDHGKTKLLDAVRSTDVVSQEAGGITQHIGAYYVKTPGGDIVFLDTPGHEAFTAMRARGAMVTDIVVLVIAAPEGVMPQTREAISHAKAANVPIIVALNKIDLEGANIENVKQQLMQHGLVPEEWGGNTVMVPISAKNNIGIDLLLENILIQAEILELKADPECRARGTIIEGRLEPGRGPVATVLIQQGTLQIGEPFVTGVYSGRIRAMRNDKGEHIEVAGPAMPVEVLGIEDVPSAGDPFLVVSDDAQAKQISARLQQIQRERELKRTAHITLEDLHSQIEAGKIKELRVIVKGDVQGSVEALCESLMKIESEKVRINIIHSGVGAVTESDVMLASTSNALIIGFNVRPHVQVNDLAKREYVDIRTYRIIYDVINDIRKAMTGMLDKTFKENVLGHAEVREVFKVSRSLSVAGLYVQDGKLLRNSPMRLLRDSVVVYEGRLSSLKRFKDDVREVASGYECGIGLENFNDIRQGDVIECFQMEEVVSTL